jgi:hypothetical protein
MTRTKYSFEVPLDNLDQFYPYQDYVFALSFLCQWDRYMDYLRRAKADGKFIILDNSFNELERPDDPQVLTHLYKETKADRVVAPDADWWSTEELFKTYWEMTKDVPVEDLIAVVRSDYEYSLALEWNLPYIAIPYEFRPYITEEALYYPNAHYLGYLNPQEVKRYRPETIDTTMPVKLALMGVDAKTWVDNGCIHIHSVSMPKNLLTTYKMTNEEVKAALKLTQEFKNGLP